MLVDFFLRLLLIILYSNGNASVFTIFYTINMQSKAATVEEYLSSLPEDRQEAIEAVRQVILDNLPEGFEETMNWGMITYEVPLETYPDTYNGKPLMFAALASKKNLMAVYL
mgnify:CR=1 FL=1